MMKLKSIGLILLGIAGIWQGGRVLTRMKAKRLVESGLSPALFDELDSRIRRGKYGRVDSLLIMQNGELFFERYYNGFDADSSHRLYSVTKSINSAVIGIALADGTIPSVETPILDLLPQYQQIASPSSPKKEITAAHLLTMTPGFRWDELSASYDSQENNVYQMEQSQDWLGYVLQQDLAAPPGEEFVYNSGASVLLGGILAEATGMRVDEYFAARLFARLGIESWEWEDAGISAADTGGGLSLRPRDMLKFGQLFLQAGEWEGEQIVPASWVQQSTSPKVTVDKDNTYGYQWWQFADTHQVVAPLTENNLYFAAGFGGQFIFVVPHLELIVVTTGSNYLGNMFGIYQALAELIIPAVEVAMSK